MKTRGAATDLLWPSRVSTTSPISDGLLARSSPTPPSSSSQNLNTTATSASGSRFSCFFGDRMALGYVLLLLTPASSSFSLFFFFFSVQYRRFLIVFLGQCRRLSRLLCCSDPSPNGQFKGRYLLGHGPIQIWRKSEVRTQYRHYKFTNLPLKQ